MRLLRCATWCCLAVTLVVCAVRAVALESSARKLVVTGQIVAVDTTEPVAGAKVKIKGVGNATTDSDGRYTVRSAVGTGGTWQVVISEPGFRRRKTWVTADDPQARVRADWNLLPKAGGLFDLQLYDHAVRGSSRSAVTSRWVEAPGFRVLDHQVHCQRLLGPDETCPVWTVTSATISSRTRDYLLGAIESVPALTGGMIPSVEFVSLSANTTMSTEELLVPGTFTVGQYDGRGEAWFPLTDRGVPIGGKVFLAEGGRGPWAVMIYVALGLGITGGLPADLCADLQARGLRTALYTRAVRNRYPDVDPAPVARVHSAPRPATVERARRSATGERLHGGGRAARAPSSQERAP